MARTREEARAGRLPPGGWLPFAAYLCALVFAAVLLRVTLPGRPGHGKGLERVYRPYLVLELPVDSAKAADCPLGEQLARGEAVQPHATLMKRQRLQPEEYLAWLERRPWEGEHLTTKVKGVEYEIYFVPAAPGRTQVPVPVGYDYRLSGNGGTGFLVTAWKRKDPGPLGQLLRDPGTP